MDDKEKILVKYNQVHVGTENIFREKTATNEDLWSFYEFKIGLVHYVDGTGKMLSLTADEFVKAREDPVAPLSRRVIENTNSNDTDQLNILCLEYGQVKTSTSFLHSIDRFGFDVIGQDTNGQWCAFRMPWETALSDIRDVEIVLKQTLSEVSKQLSKNK